MSSYEECIEKEKVSQSPHSPGLVADDEQVSRVLLTPKHVKNGQVLPVAFQDIYSSRGFSVLRLGENFDESLEKTIEDLEDENNQYVGYAIAEVSEVRAFYIPKTTYRLLIVIDTATKVKKAHADIFSTRNTDDIKKLGIKKFIKNLLRYEFSKLFKYNNRNNSSEESSTP